MTSPTTNIHSRKLKILQLVLDGVPFQCQLRNWTINNGTGDGERFYTFCDDSPDGGEFYEDAEPEYTLELSFFADWRSNGISDYLTQHDQETVDFQLDHHPGIPGEHVRWTGKVKLKAPNVGGEARTTELTETTLPIVGKPAYTRVS